MIDDDEINAMRQVTAALTPLNEEVRKRILQWAISRFSVGGITSTGEHANGERSVAKAGTNDRFDTFAELFEAAQPSTDREKALVACYWVQICQSQQSFGSQALNDSLKDLGHGVSNITDALSTLKDDRPALVLQLKKSGTSQQARKTYKLTQEGTRRVQTMIRGEG